MQIRQKVALFLVMIMLMTVVPIATVAASINQFNKTISVVAHTAITSEQGLLLDIRYTSGDVSSDVFYISGSDFLFEKEAYTHEVDGAMISGSVVTVGFDVTWLSETVLKVEVDCDGGLDRVGIPIVGVPSQGTPSISVDGRDSFVTSGTYVIGDGVVWDKGLVAQAGEVLMLSVEGEGVVGDIIIEERAVNQLSGEEITLTLPNSSELVFSEANKEEGTITLKGNRGLSCIKNEPIEVTFVDEKEIKITMPYNTAIRLGNVVIQGVQVVAANPRDYVDLGDVTICVSSEKMEDTDLVVAQIVNHDIVVDVGEVVSIKAGHDIGVVTVKVKEVLAGSFGNSPLFIEIDGAQVVSFSVIKGNVAYVDDKKDEIILTPIKHLDEPQSFEFEIALAAEVMQSGDVMMQVDGRGIEEIHTKVAEVVSLVSIEMTPYIVREGDKDTSGGEVVIEELESDALQTGDIVMKIEDDNLFITAIEVEVTKGDIVIAWEVEDGQLVMRVKRSSDEASQITIKGIQVTQPKDIVEGSYDFILGGSTISSVNTAEEAFRDIYRLENFIEIGVQEEVNKLSFKIGSDFFVQNGQENVMDVTAYISKNNYSMVPIRYLVYALGLEEQDVLFHKEKGTVTLFMNDAIVQFENGKDCIWVNGVVIPIDEQVVIKDGRTFIPIGEVGRMLGLDVSWEHETKTVFITACKKNSFNVE